MMFFKAVLINSLVYFWLHWFFVSVCRLSLVGASGGYSSLHCVGLLLPWLLLLWSTGSGYTHFRIYSMLVQQLWCMGLVAQPVESSWARDGICVPCIGRWIFTHCTTKEVPDCDF